MISARMRRPARVLIWSTWLAVAALVTACGTERIRVARSDPNYRGAVLFSQRCSGCHTLSYAATHGSATIVRNAEVTNGPNFNIRCERPATRVLYAIENGGFSGAIMPQNVVVGQDAIAVARFVATYAGRQAPKVTGVVPCNQQSIGSLPAPGSTTTATTSSTTTAGKGASKSGAKSGAGGKPKPAHP